jgi:hypothetical protein
MASFTLQSIMNMTIDNRCSKTEMISPVYFTKDATRHIQFPQQVSSKGKMKVNFITGVDRGTFGGALLYHLQRKENASMSSQLLVIWGYESDKIYLHVWLVERKSTLVWNKDKLKRLCNVYNSQYHLGSITKEWLLDDNTKLKTRCKTSYESGLEMVVIISEEKDLLHPVKPLWIDPIR